MCSSVRVRGWWRRVVVGMMLLAMTTRLAEGCPSMCACKWKGGKEWVECANRDLKGLPQGAREETQVLDLSSNHLVSLPAECFHALGLINLQRLYLAKSHISRISPRAFVGLVGLVELDLSGNLIEEIPTETFASYPSLMRLIFNANPIREVRRDSFQRLVHLTNLELSQCRLEVVEQGAFNGLISLEWLRLDGNRLTHVPDFTLPLGGNLRGLTLHNNPWLCDCRSRTMQSWLRESAPAAPQESEPVCDSPPRLRGKQIKTVKLNDLACLPQIELQERTEIYEGGNVTLKCDVHAVPVAKVTWYFNGEPCEPQNESDVSAVSSAGLPRYIYSQRGLTNITSILYVYAVEPVDEGTYTCLAENTAGSAEANLSLRVLFRERVTVEPPADHPASGYVAAIAAGVLVGTVFALSCLVGSVVYCVKKRRRERKRNSKALVSQNKSVMPITKDTTTSLSCRKGNGSVISCEHQQGVSYTEREIARTATLDRRDHRNLGDSYGSPASKYLTEPDLINEVPESTDIGYGQLYRHQLAERQILEYDSGYPMHQPDLRPANLPRVSYLDRDGYPLNFGLPKIHYSAASTLPRLRQRMAEGSAVAPPARYSREAEFLSRPTAYDPVLSRTDARYTAEGYPFPPHQPVEQPLQQQQQLQQLPVSPVASPISVLPDVPFIPSPPAAYRGDSAPLSPRSLLGKTVREAAAAAAARADDAQPPHHPESPDEGYVGDAMDV